MWTKEEQMMPSIIAFDQSQISLKKLHGEAKTKSVNKIAKSLNVSVIQLKRKIGTIWEGQITWDMLENQNSQYIMNLVGEQYDQPFNSFKIPEYKTSIAVWTTNKKENCIEIISRFIKNNPRATLAEIAHYCFGAKRLYLDRLAIKGILLQKNRDEIWEVSEAPNEVLNTSIRKDDDFQNGQHTKKRTNPSNKRKRTEEEINFFPNKEPRRLSSFFPFPNVPKDNNNPITENKENKMGISFITH